MKKIGTLMRVLALLSCTFYGYSQEAGNPFKITGSDPVKISINQEINVNTLLYPFGDEPTSLYGLGLDAEVKLNSDESYARVYFIDKNYDEYLVMECYPLLNSDDHIFVTEHAEESASLNSVRPLGLSVEIKNASIIIGDITFSSSIDPSLNIEKNRKEKKSQQNKSKIIRINKAISERGLGWIAGPTEISGLSSSERKKLFGESTFPPGFEYYSGGVVSVGKSMKSGAPSGPYVNEFDWRNRHSQNWVSPVTDQGSCGSSWAFAALGATEAQANIFFNQSELNMDLSEQDLVSCSGAGDCVGGYPSLALDYISSTGVVDETAFPYTFAEVPCENKNPNPTELIKISGRIQLGAGNYPYTEDGLKKMIIEKGPLSGGLYDWSHAMVLVGYKVVEAGDVFYYRDLSKSRFWKTVEEGDPLIGKTVWIFKNSWGGGFGDEGYVYVESDISNFGWTYAITSPVQSVLVPRQVNCTDNDGDGYYWWGIGNKPETCPDCPDLPDGDDSDPAKGPLDEFGFCTPLDLPLNANFESDTQSILAGDQVGFTDLSVGNPTSWSWVFEGGFPSTSSLQNPVIQYDSAGEYMVSLMVANSTETSILTRQAYIIVSDPTETSYCSSNGDAQNEYISSVLLNDLESVSHSSGITGYEDYTQTLTANLLSGQTYSIILNPGFISRAEFQYWKVWIDFNQDGLFTGDGEQVYTSGKSKSEVIGDITIPAGLNIETRMRVSMGQSLDYSSCGDIGFGEVEDYNVIISVPPPKPPVAMFSASSTQVVEGNPVVFTDESLNEPYTWFWDFGDGGTSSEQNPTYVYYTAGIYTVSLSVSNDDGTDILSVVDMITVDVQPVEPYCSSGSLSNSLEYITEVQVGNYINASGPGLYSDYLNEIIPMVPGTETSITITPGFTDKAQREFFRVWIDFNKNGSFNDNGETILLANNKKTSVSSLFLIPPGLSGQTRMRISMKSGTSQTPCELFEGGEVEDYTVDFGTGKSGFLSDEKNIWSGEALTVYPNPSSGLVSLKITDWPNKKAVYIIDFTGHKVLETETLSNQLEFDLSGLPNGIYLINIDDGIIRKNCKVVKN